MKIYLQFKIKKCIVVREPDIDPLIYGKKNAKGEHLLCYMIKEELKKAGFDVIKKRMSKDGHLVDDDQPYIRSRKKVKGKMSFQIYNDRYSIRRANDDFNDGEVVLKMDTNIFWEHEILSEDMDDIMVG